MGDPFVGEIRMTGFNFAPLDWALCNGQLMSIAESDALFQLIGTTYGGDGVSTFALPDLQGRIPVHVSANAPLGTEAGGEAVTLVVAQMPSHSHTGIATSAGGTATSPTGAQLAQTAQLAYHEPVGSTDTSRVGMAPDSLQLVGGSQPHDNLMPYLVVNFIISLFGIFPSQS
jgi:microcystin-dependent protein